MKRTFACLLTCLLAFPAAGQNQPAPNPASEFQARRQIVFGAAPFDGGRYLSTFVPEERRSLFLTAGFEHALTVNMSDVYYWPTTGEYKADFQGVNVPLEGELLVRSGSQPARSLPRREYIYVYPLGPQGEATRLLFDDEMRVFLNEYRRKLEDFRVGKSPLPPRESFQGPFSGFILKLEAGSYRLEYRVANKGQTFSLEKELTVFSALADGVRYEIIPGEKWTVSTQSDSANQGIFLKKGMLVFLKAFPSLLYNQAAYDLMANPNRPAAGLGLDNAAVWVAGEESLEERSGAGLELEAAGLRLTAAPRPWLVRQAPGSALGYEIVELPDKAPQRPSFMAYRIPAPPVGQPVRLRVAGAPGSSRSLLTVDPAGLGLTGLAILFPGLVPLAGLLLRRRHSQPDRANLKSEGA